MKLPHALTAIVALTFLISTNAHAEDEGEVKSRVEAWVATFNDNDPKAMVDFYENTEDIDMLVSAGLWHHGIDEIANAYKEDKKHWNYYDSNLKNLHVRNLGAFAVVAFEHLFKLRSLHEDLNLQIHIRTTMTLRKIGSDWKIVSEHSSAIHGIERATVITEKKEVAGGKGG